jgi:hypothetical protein
MSKNYNKYDWFYGGLKVLKSSIFRNASPICSFSCPSPSHLKVAFMDDVIEVQTPKEFKDANKSSSTCKFTLLDSISMA